MDETLINFGSELKAISETDDGTLKFGAWLVLYGSPERTDASRMRDYFTKSTDFDFEEGDKTTVYYNHGLDPELKRRKLGTATLHYKDAGIWMEGQLKARDEYESKIQELIKRGKLGASSGVPAHLVERKNVGEAHEILMWPLGKDASITPTPAEPMTSCVSLKSLLEIEEAAEIKDVLDSDDAEPEVRRDDDESDFPDEAETKHLTELETGLHDGLDFTSHSTKVLAANEELLERIQSLADMRCVKSNRRWSAEKYELLTDVAAEYSRLADEVKALAHAHAPKSQTPDALKALAAIELTKARLNGVPV